MRFSWLNILILLLVILFCTLPFFEGGETPGGLLLIHASTLGILGFLIVARSSLTYPRFGFYFLGFFLIAALSTALAPYHYAAALQMWDFIMAALFILGICGILSNVDEKTSQMVPFVLFLAGSFATIASAIIYGFDSGSRISSSFVNPNDFACFLLLMILLGLYSLEQESRSSHRKLLGLLLLVLFVLAGLTYSRTAVLALLAVFAMHLGKHRFKKTMLLMGGLILICGGLVFFRFFLRPSQDQFRYYRLRIWKSTLHAVQEEPYLGIGLNMLSHRALRYNFPTDVPVGRFGRVARSADSQYFQLLIETGFLGLFAFLFGWIGLFLALWKLPTRYFFLGQASTVVSVFALLSLPLNNTSILYLLCFLVTLPFALNPTKTFHTVRLGRIGRISGLVLVCLFLIYGVYFPFRAHTEFEHALKSNDDVSAEKHLKNALYYNPFQPYYRFTFVKRVVDSRPTNLASSQWLFLIQVLDDSIRLNPEESNFYLYKAKCWNYLFQKSPVLQYYSNAVSSFQAAIERDPYNPFLQLEFSAFLLLHEKNLSLSETHARRAIELEPAYLNAHLLLSEILFTEKKTAEARESFQQLEFLEQKYKGFLSPYSDSYTQKLLTLNEKHKEQLANKLF